MTHIIVGTAGHIDHGKTALVRALTGIETDRLKEEKARGISIDLGFAHLDLGQGVWAGFVDVPGHERFVRNMLAGATGIDVVLLVIAADESVMPQTREHFDICRILGIRRGAVVLTKSDLVDASTLELVRLEVQDFVAGSFLEGVPARAVSSVNGEGLDALRQDLLRMAASLEGKDTTRHFRMPVDRAFAQKGFGSVATGTVASGRIDVESEVEVYPTGKRARVRGIQNHGDFAKSSGAGQRTALNLAGVDLGQLRRGMMLGPPGVFAPTLDLGTRVELLASAPPLHHRSRAHLHAGAAEMKAEIRLLDREELAPGGSAFCRIVLSEPALLLPGDRFVLRRFSPVETIGGGTVLDPVVRAGRRKDLHSHLSNLDRATGAQRLALWAGENPYGIAETELIARSGALPSELRTAGLRELSGWFVTPESFATLQLRLTASVQEFHKQNPLVAGVSKEEIRTRILLGAPAQLLEALLQESLSITVQGDILRQKDHRFAFTQAEDQAIGLIEEAFRHGGLAVPATAEVLAKAGVDARRGQSLLQLLLKSGKLVRISTDFIFHADAILGLRSLLATRRGKRFSVPEFKDWTGISRKYAIPLLEFCDRQKLTRREGAGRVVL